jgi:biopolymer transport protein ExbD
MKYLRSILLMMTLAGSTGINLFSQAALQRGVSVQMAATTGASVLPDADKPEAWIITISEDGELYFGLDPESPDSLQDAMKVRPRDRRQELYIKADARAPFASVRKVLEIAHGDFFSGANLLTAQPGGEHTGAVAPHGLPIRLTMPTTAHALVISVATGQDGPILRFNNESDAVPLTSLGPKLASLLQNQREKVVIVKAGDVPFGDIAHVVDACNMAGAITVVETASL